MDRRPNSIRLTPKQQAVQDLDTARQALGQHLQAVTTEWNPRTMVQRSFQAHRWAWISAAGIGGLILVRFLMARPAAKFERDNSATSATKSGLIALILSSVFAMVRQHALKFATQYVQGYLHQYLSRHEGERPSA